MTAQPERGDAPAGGGAPETEIPASAAYRVSLPQFEGPLDLLLYLCKTHEIEILNIPISFVTEKYLEYLDLMESLSVEIAAEYLVMAATLCYLKSRELVPQTDEPVDAASVGEDGLSEDALDPREELIRRLLEYQKYKDAAEKLGARPIEGKTVFPRGFGLDSVEGQGCLAEHSPWKLVEYFAKLLQQGTGPDNAHNVVIDRITIGDRINQLIDRLESSGGSFRFEAMIDYELPEHELRHQVVVTLLAVLELARLKTIRVLQDPESQTFFITQVAGVSLDDARHAHVTSDVVAPEPAAEASSPEEALADPSPQEDLSQEAAPEESRGETELDATGAPAPDPENPHGET